MVKKRDEIYALPNADDTLFKFVRDDFHNNACLNACLDFADHDSWFEYIEGYKIAANLLVKNLIKSKTKKGIDTLIYPIVFLYRHYIELNLKSILFESCELLGKSFDLKPTHRLDTLWTKNKEVFAEINKIKEYGFYENFCGKKEFLKLMQSMDKLINELNEWDKDSFNFRYPVNKNQEPCFDDSRYININNLYETVQKMENFFECMHFALRRLREFNENTF